MRNWLKKGMHFIIKKIITSLIMSYYKDDFCWFKNIKYTTRVDSMFICIIVLLKANVTIYSCMFVYNWDVIK